jgi:hypothetical protein
MTDIGYCTVDDVRRVAQEASFSGAYAQDPQLVEQAITGQTTWVQKNTGMHWYVPGGVSEDDAGIISTDPIARDDEHSIPTGAGVVIDGETPDPKRAHGTYTRVRLAKRYVKTPLTLLKVRDPEASSGYTDWVADGDITEGFGADYRVQVNSGGFTEVYLDTETLAPDADDVTIDRYTNAIYIEYDYGEAELPDTVRRGVAMRAYAELVLDDDLQTSLPDDGQLTSVETKAERLISRADELLNPWLL